jgi:hypothetical protein
MLRDPSLIPLSHQHHNGLALCVLTRQGLARDASPESVARLARRILDRFELELVNHFQLEEEILFAETVRHLGELPVVAELIADHRELERLAAQLRDGPTAEVIEQFCALLSTHIRREENEFFQTVQSALPRDVLDSMGREFETRAVRICL